MNIFNTDLLNRMIIHVHVIRFPHFAIFNSQLEFVRTGNDVLPEVLFFYYVRSYVCTDTVIFISTLSRTFVLYINKENACMCRQLLRLLRSPVITLYIVDWLRVRV
jgi:hypothetical protein